MNFIGVCQHTTTAHHLIFLFTSSLWSDLSTYIYAAMRIKTLVSLSCVRIYFPHEVVAQGTTKGELNVERGLRTCNEMCCASLVSHLSAD